MKIGFVVDGDAEYVSLPLLLTKVQTAGTLPVKVLKAPVHPLGSVRTLVRGLLPAVQALEQRGAQLVVVLLDREGRNECPGQIAHDLRTALAAECLRKGVTASVDVVVKDRMFENWLVADLVALRSMPGRFEVSESFTRQVAPDCADRSDALLLLKKAARKTGYEKKRDAARILKAADPIRMAANSRSFRRFLRVVGNPKYGAQSKRP